MRKRKYKPMMEKPHRELCAAFGPSGRRHFWTDSQYRLPTAVNYAALQTGGFFRREYEDLRRPWNFTEGSEEILRFSGVQGVRKIHPTQKPLELLSYLIERSSNPGALVLDPFAGSGSTLKAAQLTGRRAIGIEMDAEYCQRAQAWLDSAELPKKRAKKPRTGNLSTDGEQLLLGLF